MSNAGKQQFFRSSVPTMGNGCGKICKLLSRFGTLLLLLLAGQLEAASWFLLPDESHFYFEVRAEDSPVQGECSPVQGEFRQFRLELDLDANQQDKASLKVSVDLGGADLTDDDINAAIAGADWFAVADFPRAVYTSNNIWKDKDTVYHSRGTLKVKGISRPVSFPFTFNESATGARMTGEFILFRTDFDVGTGEWAGNDPISTDVRLWFDLNLEKK